MNVTFENNIIFIFVIAYSGKSLVMMACCYRFLYELAKVTLLCLMNSLSRMQEFCGHRTHCECRQCNNAACWMWTIEILLALWLIGRRFILFYDLHVVKEKEVHNFFSIWTAQNPVENWTAFLHPKSLICKSVNIKFIFQMWVHLHKYSSKK